MEIKHKFTYDGQEVEQEDFTQVADNAALADDRVFAELMRVAPYTGTVSRGILPWAYDGIKSATVEGNGASGSVKVHPFRAFIGSTTAAGTDAVKALRDIRSALYTGTSTALDGTVNIAAGSGGGLYRWDLIYAAVAVEQNGPTEAREVKDATTGIAAAQNVAKDTRTTVTVSITAGTPHATTPARPSAPADAGGTYYIPLAYVRVPPAFNGTSMVAAGDIFEVAPKLHLSRSNGSFTVQVANQGHVDGGSVLTSAKLDTWATAGTRPPAYMPSLMQGAEVRLIPIDVRTGGSFSHASGSVVDDSVDWRKRAFFWIANVYASTSKFAWEPAATVPVPVSVPGASAGVNDAFGSGQSIRNDDVGNTGAANAGRVCELAPAKLTAMTAATEVTLYVDDADGKMKVYINGTPGVKMFIWVFASAPFPNP
jgi:hypothetical protein